MPITPSMEKEAALELSRRSPHISGFLSEQEIQQHKTLVESFLPVAPTDDSGTAAPIRWQPYFKWVNSILVNHKEDGSLDPKAIHVYGHWENDFLYFTGHREDYLRFRSRDSSAKIMLSVSSKSQNVEDSGYVFINSLNAYGIYRLGSVFIQIAIENSLMAGMGGRVRLNSTRDSGLFYFKLGFVPDCELTFNFLKNGENINGGEMYLPQASIEIWKNKITANPILPNDLLIPKVALFKPGTVVDSQIDCLNEPPAYSQVPPDSGNKEKIKQILIGLIKSIEFKTNHRASWFSYGITNKLQKLKAIESWLSSNNLDKMNEMKMLSLIRDISSIKRNPFGFFPPHSLIEFNEAMSQHNLQCPEKIHFAFTKLDSIKEHSDITKLLF